MLPRIGEKHTDQDCFSWNMYAFFYNIHNIHKNSANLVDL